MPIETGRWSSVQRQDRLCGSCGELGDEEHVLFRCALIRRDDLRLGDTESLSNVWKTPDVYELCKGVKAAGYL